MEATVPTEYLMEYLRATPEQWEAIHRYLIRAEGGEVVEAEATATREELKARNVFRRAGSHWDVSFEGNEVFHLADSLGARYLDYLLHHPGAVISAFDLEVAVTPDKAGARRRDSIQQKLDPETMRSYLRELTELREEREGATERGDVAGVERVDEEIEAVESALRSDGSSASDAGERARGNVRKAIAKVQRRLARGNQAEKEFGKHLRQFVSTGYECTYRQPRGRFS